MIAKAPTYNPAYEVYSRSFSDVFDFAEAPRTTYTPPEHHDGKGCPFCGSDEVDCPYPDDYDGDTVRSPWECPVCQASWNMVYTLTGFELTDPHGKVLAEFPHTAEFRRMRAYNALLDAARDAERAIGQTIETCTIGNLEEVWETLCEALAYGEDFGADLPL